MLFNSTEFAVFFPIVTLVYFLVPHRCRWITLLVASCYFYMAFIPIYILILFFTIGVDYCAGILIERSQGKNRKLLLLCSVVANVGVLAVFKYYNFFNDNLAALFKTLGLTYAVKDLSIILPIGLSFHTFQSLSYTIEVYGGHQKAERHLGIFALYVMFYPQLVAGPIERPQNLLHQLRANHYFDYQRVTDGLKLMAWGLFMKTVIADNLAPVVNTVYNDPTRHTGLPLVVATVFFAFQIYSDFAGYSYIAIGAAQVMGIKLMVNFRQPYFSKSVSEFWRRWHISLSTWFRDYVYIPLGGNRVVRSRQYLNLLIVFTISGLWHGANWVFVIWGMLHGLYIVSSMWFADWANKLKHGLRLQTFPALLGFLQVMITFALVCFAWIFFRANSVTDAFYIVTHLFAGRGSLAGIGLTATFPAVAGIVAVGVIEILQQKISIKDILPRQPFVVRWAGYYLIILMICLYGRFGKEQFIYFQF